MSGSNSKSKASTSESEGVELKGLELALSRFRLIDPIPAPDRAWEGYAKRRSDEQKHGYCASEQPEYEDGDEWYEDDEGVHATTISCHAIEFVSFIAPPIEIMPARHQISSD